MTVDPEVVEQYRDSTNLRSRAALYRYTAGGRPPWFARIRERIDPSSGSRILEVGCGPGTLWEGVTVVWDLVLTDLSEGMVRECRDRTEHRFRYAVVDAESLPFADATFDVVVSCHVLFLIPDLARALAEIRRVLVPGGRLVATTNGDGHLSEIKQLRTEFGLGQPDREIMEKFGLEVAPRRLEGHFEVDSIDRVDGELRIPDPQPVIDYMRSLRSVSEQMDADIEASIRTRVGEALEEHGHFLVNTRSAILVAQAH
jgi:SAM-dependent methyltransferase